jgi:hypothetical protein
LAPLNLISKWNYLNTDKYEKRIWLSNGSDNRMQTKKNSLCWMFSLGGESTGVLQGYLLSTGERYETAEKQQVGMVAL